MILTPEQAYAVLLNLQEPERTLTLLASGTGLRISECLGLQWQDVSFADAMIHVRRTWTCGQVGLPKSKASKGPVPLHPLLADFMCLWKEKTQYSQPGDWVFPSFRLEGKQPRVANMLVEDHLRPAAVKAGILSSHPDAREQLVDDDPRRFGFHNLAPQPRVVSHPHQNRSKDRANSASPQRRQVNTSVLHSCGQPRSNDRSGENAYSNSQPCGGPKRAESGLEQELHRRKFFNLIQMGRQHLVPFGTADWKRTGVSGMILANFFGMMVARDGVEPPTPAFSVRSTIRIW